MEKPLWTNKNKKWNNNLFIRHYFYIYFIKANRGTQVHPLTRDSPICKIWKNLLPMGILAEIADNGLATKKHINFFQKTFFNGLQFPKTRMLRCKIKGCRGPSGPPISCSAPNCSERIHEECVERLINLSLRQPRHQKIMTSPWKRKHFTFQSFPRVTTKVNLEKSCLKKLWVKWLIKSVQRIIVQACI